MTTRDDNTDDNTDDNSAKNSDDNTNRLVISFGLSSRFVTWVLIHVLFWVLSSEVLFVKNL
jgi:hypothetical protein